MSTLRVQSLVLLLPLPAFESSSSLSLIIRVLTIFVCILETSCVIETVKSNHLTHYVMLKQNNTISLREVSWNTSVNK